MREQELISSGLWKAKSRWVFSQFFMGLYESLVLPFLNKYLKKYIEGA